MNEHEHEQTPAELRQVAQSLDALAARDSGAAHAGLADRVFEASRGAISEIDAMPVVVARLRPARLRVAAAVVVLVGGALTGAMLLRAHPKAGVLRDPASAIAIGQPATSSATDDETLLDSASEAVDLALASLTTETGTLLTELQSFSADPLSNWSASDAVQVGDSM